LLGSATYTGVTTLQAGSLTMVSAPAWAPVLSGPGGAVVNGGRMVFDYNASTDPANTIKTILTQTAYNNNFATGQIRTTNAPDSKHTLGWFDDTANKKLRVGYTYTGDANVDGKVDTSDFTALGQNFGSTTAVWG